MGNVQGCSDLNRCGELDALFVRYALLFSEISRTFMSYMSAFEIREEAANDYLSYARSGMDEDVLAQFKKDYESAMEKAKDAYHTEINRVVGVLVAIIKVLSVEKKALENVGIIFDDNNRFEVYKILKDEYVPVLYAFLPLLHQMNLVPR